jgi:methyltransferase (TIGR00027 family)
MMADGYPSATARRVAAYRMTFERLDAPYGAPAADHRLTQDVAGGQPAPEPGQGMWTYLRGRTAFFDRVVVNAMDRGVAQVVSVGAGYDGRALRYAQRGVRWWEVDHPVTQADKRERLHRLGIEAGHVRFVPLDLRDGGLAAGLRAAGFEPDGPALLLCEGVAVYLELDVLRRMLEELRTLATVGTRLAISLGARMDSPDRSARRQTFEASVAALGEPARNHLDAARAGRLMAATRWRVTEISERAMQAGFMMVAPVWAPPADGSGTSEEQVARYLEQMLYRAGADTLSGHLEDRYGVRVKATKELDVGVHRVDLGGRRRWIARVFPAVRREGQAEADAALLEWLRGRGIPAERPIEPEPGRPGPVSVHAGQAVLLTEMVGGRPAAADSATFALLGRLLARLHRLTPEVEAARRPGGAWHHLVLDAGLAEEADACAALLHAARHRAPAGDPVYAGLWADVAQLPLPPDLPEAFGHPDLVPRNLITGPDLAGATLIDWAGAGWYPRIASLGCLLWAAAAGPPGPPAARCVRAAAEAYAAGVKLDPAELDVLEPAMGIRPVVLAAWMFATGRASRPEADRYRRQHRAAIRAVADLAAGALAGT